MNRRLLLKSVPIAPLLLAPRSLSPLLAIAPPPKFWFGDRVAHCWECDEEGIEHQEPGTVYGLYYTRVYKPFVGFTNVLDWHYWVHFDDPANNDGEAQGYHDLNPNLRLLERRRTP